MVNVTGGDDYEVSRTHWDSELSQRQQTVPSACSSERMRLQSSIITIAPFAGKLVAPCTSDAFPSQTVLEQVATEPLTLFTVPPGYVLTEDLAALFAHCGRPVIWLRLGPEDCDPAALLVSLIGAARRLCPHVGTSTLERMRRQPGPTAGWPPLFAQLGHEFTERLPTNTALVLEHVHYLNEMNLALGFLEGHFLPALPDGWTCVLFSERDVTHPALPARIRRHTVGNVRLNRRTAHELAERAGSELPDEVINRIVTLTDGRAVALAGLGQAGVVLGVDLVQHAVRHASSNDDLLTRIARAWFVAADANSLRAMSLAVRLGYEHSSLTQAALGRGGSIMGPWFQPLAEGWRRTRATWRAPLRATLRAGSTPSPTTIRRAAGYFLAQGAVEQAAPLYLDVGEIEGATRAIAGVADQLMALGQWETLREWLNRLPAPALRAEPWLIYIGGEIAAAQGNAPAARCAFALAASLFTARHNTDGACQSLLAESALATWQGDCGHAQARARAADALARSAGLAWHQGWAGWHLGCLAAAAGDLDDALIYFDRAAGAADEVRDPAMAELLRLASALTLRQRELRRQREFHRQAYFAADQAEREIAARLREMVTTPSDRLDALLEAHGWARTPLILKLPSLPSLDSLPESDNRPGLWRRLLSAVGLYRRLKAPPTTANEHTGLTEAPPAALLTATPPALDIALPEPLPLALAPPTGVLSITDATPNETVNIAAAPDAPTEPTAQHESAQATLTVHLLGAFRITLNERVVEKWPSGRGRAVFKYLLIQHPRPVSRDLLMDTFWPESNSEAARNSLNVALHGLRQGFRAAAGDVTIVLFHDGAYRLNPVLRLWIDVEEFERHIKAGRRLENDGQLALAAAEYEVATSLYQGDFLDDDLYEDWPVLQREQLRIAYLETLDRLSCIYFSQSQYAACATLCQLILGRDNCREDAHCRLMRCYSRQNQHYLALRQYQSCAEALQSELDVAPSPLTAQLYERIRKREWV